MYGYDLIFQFHSAIFGNSVESDCLLWTIALIVSQGTARSQYSQASIKLPFHSKCRFTLEWDIPHLMRDMRCVRSFVTYGFSMAPDRPIETRYAHLFMWYLPIFDLSSGWISAVSVDELSAKDIPQYTCIRRNHSFHRWMTISVKLLSTLSRGKKEAKTRTVWINKENLK